MAPRKASSDTKKEIEAMNGRIDALRKDFERLEKEMHERQERNLMPSGDAVRRNVPPQVETGAGKAALVGYMIPPAALLYGATLLGERVTVAAIAGLLLILAGVALAGGAPEIGEKGPPEPA